MIIPVMLSAWLLRHIQGALWVGRFAATWLFVDIGVHFVVAEVALIGLGNLELFLEDNFTLADVWVLHFDL